MQPMKKQAATRAYERPTLTKAGKFAGVTAGTTINKIEFLWPRRG